MRLLQRHWMGVLGLAILIVFLGSGQGVGAPRIQSSWTTRPVVPDGAYREEEWGRAEVGLRLRHGWMLIQNDASALYLLVDLSGDTVGNPPRERAPWGDFVSVTFDVNGDREITPNVDVSYGLYPGTYRVGVQSYLGPGAWTGLQRSRARFVAGFGRSMGPSPPHRIWELAIPLAEIRARPGQLIRLGLNAYSESPRFNDYHPANFSRDFSNLTEISLAVDPATEVKLLQPGVFRVAPEQGPKVRVQPLGEAPASEGVPTRTIKPDGTVQIRYPDGRIEERFQGGIRIIYPDGRQEQRLFSTQAPVAIPPSVPRGAERAWLEAHSEGLLEIIRSLVENDEVAINNYREYEGYNIALYERIGKRRMTIQFLISP